MTVGTGSIPQGYAKVLLLNHTAILGGAERSMLGLLDTELPGGTVRFEVASPPGDLATAVKGLNRGLTLHEVRPVTLSFSRRPSSIVIGLRSVLESRRDLRKIVKHANVDLIHANSLRAALLAVVAGAGRRVPIVFHARDELPGNVAGRVVRRILRRNTRGVIAVSRWIGASFAGFDRVGVIDNPVNLAAFRPSGATKRRSGEVVALLVAQISPWKQQDHAIQAVVRAQHQGLAVRLRIVGSVKFSATTRLDNEAYYRSLQKLVADAGAGSYVEFLGERSDIDALLRESDVLLSTSSREPFGRTVAEALASHVQVIASDDGGPAELVEDGVTGHIYESGDIEALTDKLAAVVGQRSEEADSHAQAFETVRTRFDPNAHRAAVEKFYSEVLRD